MDFQINENFVCLLSGLLMALGANMGPKSFQNGARWGVEIAPCFRARRGLGGVLEPLEPQETPRIDFRRFLIDFRWFWVDFWLFFGRF